MTLSIPQMLSPATIQFWTVLGIDQPKLIEIDGCEQISRPYAFQLKMRSEAYLPLDLDRLIGSRAHIRIRLPDSNAISAILIEPAIRDFCGILSRVSFDGVDDHFSYYSATLRPRLWSLGKNRNFRFFSEKTTKQIVTSVLPADLPIDWRLSSELSASDSCFRYYCVQYGESDLRFVSRLLEEDGMFYFFEHRYDSQPEGFGERAERLVITDHIAPVPDAEIPVHHFESDRGGNREATRIRKWKEIRKVVPRTIDSLDRHFQRPATLVNAVYPTENAQASSDSAAPILASPDPDSQNSGNASDHPVPRDPATLTHYPSGIARRFDDVGPGGGSQPAQLEKLDSTAERDARIKTQRLALRRSMLRGSGDVANLTPGNVFRVLRGQIGDLNPYYTTSVSHRVRLATSIRSGADEPKLIYKNRFACQPTTLPYRAPMRSKKPSVNGLVTATVVSDLAATDDEICVDKYGRIKVVFPWQLNDKQPSCWIRVSQFWAGPRWGAYFWPRVGHEVLVAFEHGDPDRPVVVGSVYNSANMPPLTLPEHKQSCGIHSCSHRGNPLHNSNIVSFHDKLGSEYLQLHSETNLSLSSETKKITKSAGDSITFRGHHWIFDPSGSNSGGGGSDATGDNDAAESNFKDTDGGGVIDFLKDLVLDFNKADVEYAVGDSFSKSFGRTFETYFGCNIWLGCDPIEMFEWAASKAATPIPSFIIAGLFGAAGQGATTFGGKHDIQYGKNVSVHRGAKIEKRCQSAIGMVSTEAKGNETSVDVPAACVCEAAVAVVLLMEFIVMLLTRVANNHDTKGWHGFLKFGNVWTRFLLPRLQGIIEVAETTCGRLDIAAAEAKGTVEQSEDAVERTARALVTTDGTAGISIGAAKSEIEITADAIRNSAKRLKEAAEELLGLI